MKNQTMIMFDAATAKRKAFIKKVSDEHDSQVRMREQLRRDNLRKLNGNWFMQGRPRTAAE